MIVLTKAQKRILKWAAAAADSPGEHYCFDGYEMETARALERKGLATVRRRIATLTDAGWKTAHQIQGVPSEVMIG